jgi:REP element-mobilizing transposase RayT
LAGVSISIFHMREDRSRYLELLTSVQKKAPFVLHAYCLMDNHVHLLLQKLDEPLGDIMKRIGTSYVYWLNVSMSVLATYSKHDFAVRSLKTIPIS